MHTFRALNEVAEQRNRRGEGPPSHGRGSVLNRMGRPVERTAGVRHNTAVLDPLYRIVMHEPEIPNNTGNIGRTCIAAGCALHLIRPLGFDTSEKALRRAGLDYWPRLDVCEHDDWHAFLAEAAPARIWVTSGLAGRPAWEADLRPGDAIVFGKETAGLPAALLAAYADRAITLPMVPGERGLNVATAVCAIIYEGVRQCVARGDLSLDSSGRIRR